MLPVIIWGSAWDQRRDDSKFQRPLQGCLASRFGFLPWIVFQ